MSGNKSASLKSKRGQVEKKANPAIQYGHDVDSRTRNIARMYSQPGGHGDVEARRSSEEYLRRGGDHEDHRGQCGV